MMFFSTKRLEIVGVKSLLQSGYERPALLQDIVEVLKPSVVVSLPLHFHRINSDVQADAWLLKMEAESDLYVIKEKSSVGVIGFIFLYQADDGVFHLGYVFMESQWGQGYASEVLHGLIMQCKQAGLARKLVGGVDEANLASIKVLQRSGFTPESKNNDGVIFYHYNFS